MWPGTDWGGGGQEFGSFPGGPLYKIMFILKVDILITWL